jgi:hypothetical protein
MGEWRISFFQENRVGLSEKASRTCEQNGSPFVALGVRKARKKHAPEEEGDYTWIGLS